MPNYRKKPVVVEAHLVTEWADDFESFEKLAKWCNGEICWTPEKYAGILIKTLEGAMRADVGDWIIKEPYPTGDRRFYPCKPDIFEATYEKTWE